MTKYFIFLFTSVLFSSETMMAQFGLIAEANVSNYSNEDLSNKGAVGYGFGVAFKSYIYDKGYFTGEISYSAHSIVLDGYDRNDPTDQFEAKFTAENINVSFLLSHYFIENDGGFFIGPQAGPTLLFLNSWRPEPKADNSNSAYKPLGYTNLDFSEFKPINAGVLLGLTVGYDMFSLNLRYNQMLTNSLRGFVAVDQATPREPELKQNTLTISFNYFFL